MLLEGIDEDDVVMPFDNDEFISDEDESESEESEAENSDSEVSYEDCDSDTNSEPEEDEVASAMIEHNRKKQKVPPPITTGDFIMDICFHPTRNLIALGDISGNAELYQYGNENKLIDTYDLHITMCKDVEFDMKGDYLFSASRDRSVAVIDISSGKLKNTFTDCHFATINCLTCLDENMFATGDILGIVQIWDLRQKDSVFFIRTNEFLGHNDASIHDMISTKSHKHITCATEQSKLIALDVTAGKVFTSTKNYVSDFTCLGLLESEKKLIAATSMGNLYVYDWLEFGQYSNKWKNQKTSITCMTSITENIAVFGGEDGTLKASHLFPHIILGKVGQHTTGIEKLEVNHNKKYIASIANDNDIMFSNVSYFESLEKKIVNFQESDNSFSS